MFRLTNPTQRYEWGSTTVIPELLGVEPDGQPVAELWLGAHPVGPSSIRDGSGAVTALSTLIERAPLPTLGAAVYEGFGGRMPYLLKVLAAARPLSLQVHPRADQARLGFRREEAMGTARAATHRNFRDGEHKPEMLVALSHFEALCGFRTSAQVVELLADLRSPLATTIRDRLLADGDGGIRRAFIDVVQGHAFRDPRAIEGLVAEGMRLADARSQWTGAYQALATLARHHPGDPGAVASLMLHHIVLAPGEALFVPPGTLHAYLHGAGVELMASSDNVIRAGLTRKHVDVEMLLECSTWEARPPVRPDVEHEGFGIRRYRVPASEFGLVVGELDGAGAAVLPGEGPRIALCLEGAVILGARGGTLALRRGQSAFVPHADGGLVGSGTGVVVVAFVPPSEQVTGSGRGPVTRRVAQPSGAVD